MGKSVSLHTLGCKLNYSETSTLAGKFHSNGFNLKEYGEASDIFVLNTCSVTDNADKECRQIIRSVLSRNPETYIIVTGCYAQLQPNEIAEIHGVDLVLGANEKFRLFDYVNGFEKKELSCVFTSPAEEITNLDYAYSSDVESRTRAFLKIQDGCDYNCSFCTIPLARGKSRSLPLNTVIENAKKILDLGYKEIVLTGVNTGDYTYQNGSPKINKLIDILYELEKLNISRIRISSIEPNLLTDEIIELVSASDSFCNHFHIPLQSGDPETLKLMRRRYNRDFYAGLIHKLNNKIPQLGIGVDVIIGFPGETDERFWNTFRFLEELQVSYLHVFTYSERRNTYAVTLPGRVEMKDRKERSRILRELSNKKKMQFYARNTGIQQKVLFETAKEDDHIYGFTDNYIKVRAPHKPELENSIMEFEISGADTYRFAEGKIL
ncbi:MAG TPA: tRNA (N(6)-L-threonylcarbamoyladenosine(37)-C(2))-methylthiotransferase MtaB [Ignavibacteria bacterium]|nr:tRNA (N(6)-L-threonylcarbamoyladenosine(37)-C(2))-methylthiotransferase MtaB [Bacteroidota bacterium]HRE09776.1 tRNA (N(6)-L-threonylcarbamoyladenosine(37)-C(2))-methylthiotransferase MtaB [Ignavibacteria bacterium]HRF65499.1 tRNA (N(6)-L-threonylcarbamoyladenosine(37)-C(2))-methylthiotransferase MtaB [Ignavibacteria bacterium]HRJ03006.1 tRNA (N(6)-L-threonylcarbamoyladenosine(37)-C(2))-methylthiotransferase MtaB [Ignavibacteria bacterium]